jgi:hypothetical protein
MDVQRDSDYLMDVQRDSPSDGCPAGFPPSDGCPAGFSSGILAGFFQRDSSGISNTAELSIYSVSPFTKSFDLED